MQQAKLIQKAMQSLSEDDFSKRILMVLLEKIGYQNIEFNGGPYEEGKDVIAQFGGGLGQSEIHVFQSKKYKSQKSSLSRQQFSEYTYQLRQCIDKPIHLKDGTKRRPNKAFFVTPYPVDARHLKEQFESLSIPNIEVVDGNSLAQLILKHWPSFSTDTSSDVEIAINPDIREVLNSELKSALHIKETKNYSEYYSDLNFFVGGIESSRVIGSNLQNKTRKTPPYSYEEWIEIKRTSQALKTQGISKLFLSPEELIEAQYNSALKIYNSRENTNAIKQADSLKVEISKKLQTLSSELNQTIDKHTKLANQDSTPESSGFEEARQTLSHLEYLDIDFIINKAQKIPARGKLKKKIHEIIHDLYDARNEIFTLKEKLHAITKIIKPVPLIQVDLDPEPATEELNTRIKSAEQEIRKLKNGDLTSGEIRAALDEINGTLRSIEIVINQNNSAVEFSISQEVDQKHILDISAHKIFDAGCNIAIYGDAGAGKTTTLHMYAEKLYRTQRKGQITLFLPLNRITKKIGAIDQSKLAYTINKDNPFESLLNSFLLYKELSPSTENRAALTTALRESKKCTIIVDALDEASSHAPWIIQALSSLPKNVSHAQVITSSRHCIKYIREIEFLGITLLPFTKTQLRTFIFGWIKDVNDANELWDIVENKKLYEVAKNPLLATIICSLHSNQITIPENEPEIYWKKIELLCGLYDQHKGINRTSNDSSFLESCCIKLGYRFHIREIREASISEINKSLFNGFENRYPIGKIESAVEDLIYTCNILTKQPDSENYGFEHLRYQELLAAKEIERNRSIDIAELVGKEWWKGALYLYSFNNDIQFLIDEIYQKKGNISNYKDALIYMSSARPVGQHDILKQLINKLSKQDAVFGFGDHYIFDSASYDDY